MNYYLVKKYGVIDENFDGTQAALVTRAAL